jgi:hypothetical protein
MAQKIIIGFIAFAVGILLTILLLKPPVSGIDLSVNQCSLIGMFIICFLLILFVIISALKSGKNYKAALAFPDGTIRAIIALLSLIFFVLLAVIFYFASPPNNTNAAELQRQILTIMGTLVTAVCAFYFGAKATEQGNKIAQDTFAQIKNDSSLGQTSVVPDTIIQEAITLNKADWMKQYGCLNITLGKKVTSDTTQGTSCIMFVVPVKTDNSGATPVPLSITYTTKGTTYQILTDVQTQGLPMGSICEDEQYSLVQAYIIDSGGDLKKQYTWITGLAAAKIQSPAGSSVEVGLVVQAATSTDASAFPKAILIKKYNVLTKVEQAGKTSPQAAISLDSGISRKNDKEFGTTGVNAIYKGQPHILSCFHVYFNEELLHGITSVKEGDTLSNNTLVSPCFFEDGTNSNPVGTPVAGSITDFVDVAVMRPAVTVAKLSSLPGPVFPYRTLARIHENNVNLRFWGNGSKTPGVGTVRNISATQWITYDGIGQRQINNLIQIDRCAVAGDSGAAACDLLGNFIGIVLASDDNFTYILSAFTIEDKTDYTFPKS